MRLRRNAMRPCIRKKVNVWSQELGDLRAACSQDRRPCTRRKTSFMRSTESHGKLWSWLLAEAKMTKERRWWRVTIVTPGIVFIMLCEKLLKSAWLYYLFVVTPMTPWSQLRAEIPGGGAPGNYGCIFGGRAHWGTWLTGGPWSGRRLCCSIGPVVVCPLAPPSWSTQPSYRFRPSWGTWVWPLKAGGSSTTTSDSLLQIWSTLPLPSGDFDPNSGGAGAATSSTLKALHGDCPVDDAVWGCRCMECPKYMTIEMVP